MKKTKTELIDKIIQKIKYEKQLIEEHISKDKEKQLRNHLNTFKHRQLEIVLEIMDMTVM